MYIEVYIQVQSYDMMIVEGGEDFQDWRKPGVESGHEKRGAQLIDDKDNSQTIAWEIGRGIKLQKQTRQEARDEEGAGLEDDLHGKQQCHNGFVQESRGENWLVKERHVEPEQMGLSGKFSVLGVEGRRLQVQISL